jgi:hypothetical protein
MDVGSEATMTDASALEAVAELLPCPFCGCTEIDPKEWMRNDGVWGPGCMKCGATATSNDTWNRRAALDALGPADTDDGWRPIAAMPKDGTVIDVWLGDASDDEVDFYCTPGTRRSAGWHWFRDKWRPKMAGLQILVFVQPTHGRPLPLPPQRAQEGEG